MEYDETGDFREGIAAVGKNGKWGHINKKGKVVTPIKYDYASDFSEGFAVVGKSEKYGYVNKKGKIVIPIKFWAAAIFKEGLAAVNNIQYLPRWGFINKKGKIVIPVEYECVDNEEIPFFEDGYLEIQKIYGKDYHNRKYKLGRLNRKGIFAPY